MRRFCYYLHFADEETGMEGLSLSKLTTVTKELGFDQVS